MDMFSIANKKAIITGGCSGIGKAICEGFYNSGADIALIDYSNNITEVCDEIANADRPIYGIRGNLARRDSLINAFKEAIAVLGTVDILINCAGSQKRVPAIDFPMKDWDYIIEINLTSVFQLCKSAGRIMLDKGSGKIINIASMHSFNANSNIPAYIASKGGVSQLTKALAVEWAEYGVNVNAIAPGFIKTGLTSALWENKSKYDEIVQRIPVGRWGKPSDLIGTAIFLASSASDYLCGAIIPVDGGFLIR